MKINTTNNGVEKALNTELIRTAIVDLIADRVFPQIKAKYLGKCYRVGNVCTCLEDEMNYWYKYMQVKKIINPRIAQVSCFEINCNGEFEVSNKIVLLDSLNNEISKEEYNFSYQNILAKVQSFQKAV